MKNTRLKTENDVLPNINNNTRAKTETSDQSRNYRMKSEESSNPVRFNTETTTYPRQRSGLQNKYGGLITEGDLIETKHRSLKEQLTSKLVYCGNLKKNLTNTPSRNSMVPVALSRTMKTEQDEENRIPSPIRNKLNKRPSSTHKYITTVKSTDVIKINRTMHGDSPLKLNKPEEYDTTLITSNPKKITLLDKLQQLSQMTKPKSELKLSTTDNIDLRVEISLNDQLEELQTNRILKNDFRQAARRTPDQYKFVIVPQWMIEQYYKHNFMTVSLKSITHQCNGDVHYFSLTDFLMQQTLYQQIKAIPFFQQYKRWRNFTLLKNFMRKNYIRQTQNDLSDRMLLFEKNLMEATNRNLTNFQSIGMLDVVNFYQDGPKGMEDFTELQVSEIRKVVEQIRENDRAIVDNCIKACRTSQTAFLSKNRIKSDEDNETSKRGHLIGDNSNRKMEQTRKAAMSTHFKKLVKFIRLNDLLLSRSSLNLAIDILKKVKEALTVTPQKLAASKSKKRVARKAVRYPLFIVDLKQDQNNKRFEFNPGKEAFYSQVEQVINQSHKDISKVTVLSNNEAFKDYMVARDDEAKDAEEDSNILHKITSHTDYEILKCDIRSIVSGSFEELESFKESNQHQWVEVINELLQLDADLYREKSIEETDAYLDKLDRYRIQVKEIKEENDLGLYKLKTERMRDEVDKVIRDTVMKFHVMTPKLLSERSEELQKTLREAKDQLGKVCKSVGDFVHFYQYQRKLQLVWEDLFMQNTNIQLLKDLAKKHAIKVNDADWELAGSYTMAVEELLNKAQDSEDEQKDKWRRRLEKDIPELDKNSLEIQDIMENELYDRQCDEAETDQILNEIKENKKQVDLIKKNLKDYETQKEVLDCGKAIPDSIEEICSVQEAKLNLWSIKSKYEKSRNAITEKKFDQLNFETIQKEIEENMQLLSKAKSWLRDDNECSSNLTLQIREQRDLVVSLGRLVTPTQQERHKMELNSLIGFEFQYKDHINSDDVMEEPIIVTKFHSEYTVGELVKLNVDKKVKDLVFIDMKARKEKDLQAILDNVHEIWNQDFKVNIQISTKTVPEIKQADELFEQIDDSLAKVADVQSSKFAPHFADAAEKWSMDLQMFQKFLMELLACQRTQNFLENIFKAKDIKMGLEKHFEALKQIKVDQDTIIKDIKDVNCNVYNYINRRSQAEIKETNPRYTYNEFTKEFLSKVVYSNNKLSEILKEVEKQLEEKRKLFFRFYFLSSDELLDLLSSQEESEVVVNNLKKFFDNIFNLGIDGNQGRPDGFIKSLISEEGEVLMLNQRISTNEQIDKWLNNLQTNMINSLKEKMYECLNVYKEKIEIEQNLERKVWIERYNSQLVVTICQLLWTREVEAAFTRKRVKDGLIEVRDLTDEFLTDQRLMMKEKMSGSVRRRVIAIITGEVHNKDVVDMMVEADVLDPNDFNWRRQLRYYMPIREIEVEQVNSKILQGYEYLGALSRLVITPLTERCWNTITGALALRLGAAPAGPAGTGKTESVKDLAKGLAIYCIVFNCGPTIETKMIETLCCGLINQGAWACLDEFNRIRLEVLSVVAEMMSEIKDKRQKESSSSFTESFQGIQNMRYKQSMGVYITMNPGYAGRNELPDNLQVSFRPVAMMVPNYRYIAEIMIYSNGFEAAREKSNKLAKLLILCSEQLSQQPHQDFGMRALKSILVKAGEMKKNFQDLNEKELLIRAMINANIPKFLKEDKELFKKILVDLYPDVTLGEMDYSWLENSVKDILDQEKKSYTKGFQEKLLEFQDTTNLRFGVMLVGPPSGGKSVIQKTLATAVNLVQEKQENSNEETTNSEILNLKQINHTCINPKSITKEELQGMQDRMTGDWKEGLASSIMKRQVKQGQVDMKWIVFDGPVDAVWIEDMNSVLDDSMLLCLGNGERIKLNLSMRILFECEDLVHASLATVSRVAIIQVPEETVGWKVQIETFLRHTFLGEHKHRLINEDQLFQVLELFKTQIPNIVTWQRNKIQNVDLTEPITTNEMQLIQCAGNLFHSMIEQQCTQIQGLIDEEKLQDIKVISEDTVCEALDRLFLFSVIWAQGSGLDESKKVEFSDLLKSNFKKLMSAIPGFQTDFYPRFEDLQVKFTKWDEIIPRFKFDRELSQYSLVVPTKETVSQSCIMEWEILCEYPVFFTGQTGVGKTISCQKLLGTLENTVKLQPVQVYQSAQTSSQITQKLIEDKFKGVGMRNVIGPSAGQNKGVLMIDDVNMPLQEEWDAQPPVELIRQFIGFGSLQDRATKEHKLVKKVVTVCCAAPPTGSRAKLSKRFSKFFHILNFPKANVDTLGRIFNGILGGWTSITLSADFQELAPKVVQSCIKIYEESIKKLKPTPVKSHQYFNLRDVSKMIQGIMMTNKNTFPKKETMVKLVAHEAQRVFKDRLIEEGDLKTFDDLLAKILKSDLSLGAEEYKHIFSDVGVIFCNFNKPDNLYNLPDSIELVKAKCTYQLREQNADSSEKMNLVFFTDATKHICRISRVLKQSRGNGLLVGISGSGRQSLTKLSTKILEYKMKQVVITKNFKMDDFNKLLIELMKTTGAELQESTFMINDADIKFEAQVECINNLLNTGEVPNLFETDPTNQRDAIMQLVRENANRINFTGDKWQYFVSCIRERLHIVMTMNPIGDDFRTRIRNFPSIVNCSAIDWFHPWPLDALLEVAQDKFQGFNLDINKDKDAEWIQKIIKVSPMVHKSVKDATVKFAKQTKRQIHVTPKNYLDLIESYKFQFRSVKKKFDQNIKKQSAGVQIMNETKTKAVDLVSQVSKLRPEVEVKKQNAVMKSKKAEEEEAKATIVLESQTKIKEEVEKAKAEAMDFLNKCDKELKEAEKFKQTATSAVEKLKEENIREVANYKLDKIVNMGGGVDKVLQAVVQIITGKMKLEELRPTLSKPKNLKQFNLNLIETEFEHYRKICSTYKKWYEDQKDDITFDKINNKSQALGSLFDWTVNIQKYQAKIEEVVPLKQLAKKAKDNADQQQARLEEEERKYKELMDQVQRLRDERDQALKDSAYLEDLLARFKLQLENSGTLTECLEDEYNRWSQNVLDLNEQIIKLVGDVFLASCAISQQGPFQGTTRDALVESWKEQMKMENVPFSDDFEIENVLASQLEVRNWRVNSLPSDKVSCSNACLATRSLRIPIMIDPQELAYTWLKRTGEKVKPRQDDSGQFKLVKNGDKQSIKTIEKAIEMGWALLYQDVVEKLDNNIDLLLNQKSNNIGSTAERLEQRFNERDLIMHPEFKMQICTKISNPNQLPETFIKATVINFLVTQEGLEEDLLTKTVGILRPEDEELRANLIEKIAKNDEILSETESKILDQLLDTQNKDDQNVLEDNKLISMLKDSKEKSTEIKESKATAEATNEKLIEERKKYINVSIRGSILYFILTDLAVIDNMYQFSLEKVQKLFCHVIVREKHQDKMENFIQHLEEQVTSYVFSVCGRSIFEEHKLVFSFFIASKIGLREKSITQEEYWYFLTGAKIGFESKEKSQVEWLSDKIYNQLVTLEAVSEDWASILENLSKQPERFKRLINSENIHNEEFPQAQESLDSFKKSLFVKAVKPEKLMFMMKRQVRDKIGEEQASPQPTNLAATMADSDERSPIIFILSKGADPSDSIKELSRTLEKDNERERDRERTIREISLGSGSEEKALQAISTGAAVGNWVILCNCHLFEDWLPNLLIQTEKLGDKNAKVNKDFRLFLTAMPCKRFPIPILQNGIKIAYEPPKGLKKNIMGSLLHVDEERLNERVKHNLKDFKRLVFGAIFLHGIILERKKYGPLGQNKMQDFNESDLSASLDTLSDLCNRKQIPQDAIEYMIGEITQGGRVTEEMDFRTLRCTLKMFLNSDVNTQKNQKQSKSGIYFCPPVEELSNIDNWVEQVKTMPDQDPPEIFGMHSNADITYQMNTTNKYLDMVLSTISDESAGDDEGDNADKLVLDMINKFVDVLPEPLRRSESSKSVLERGLDGSISVQTVYLQHEMEKFSKLIVKVKEMLLQLADAIKGIALMSNDLDHMLNAFTLNQVPPSWKKLSFLSLKPLRAWLDDLIARVKQLRSWLTGNFPHSHWLTVYYFPQGFLTSVLQAHARKYKIEIDTIDFTFDTFPVTQSKSLKVPDEGIYIQGLQCDGFGQNFERNEMADQQPGVPFCESPVFHFIPQKTPKMNATAQICPIYKTTLRTGTLSTTGASTNYIRSISMQQSMDSPDQWVKKGAALLCNLDQ